MQRREASRGLFATADFFVCTMISADLREAVAHFTGVLHLMRYTNLRLLLTYYFSMEV